MELAIWDNNSKPKRVSYDYNEATNTYHYDWCTFTVIKVDRTHRQFLFHLTGNTTNEDRRIRIYVSKLYPTGGYICEGYIDILQLCRANDNDYADEGSFNVTFKYHKKLYTSEATTDNNGQIVYKDKDVEKLIDKLSQKEGVETVVSESDMVTFYDKDDGQAYETLSKIGQPVEEDVPCMVLQPRPTRADGFRFGETGALAYFALFDDTGFKDTYFFKNIKAPTEYYDHPHIKSIGLNDKVSSLAVAYNGDNPELCAVLVVWEDSDYNFQDHDRKKHRISIIATKDNPQVSYSNLKRLPCLSGRDSWNDRISSISFHIGYVDSQLKDY